MKEDRYCAVCHHGDEDNREGQGTVDMVIDRHREEGRILSVMAPILYEKRCVECHSALGEKDSPNRQIMGFLSTDYSLEQLDMMVTKRRLLIIATVFASLLLGMIALRIMFTWFLERPIGELITGTKRIAAGQLDFRFDQAVTGIQHAIKNMLGVLTGGAYLVSVGAAKDNRERIEEGNAMVKEGIEQTKPGLVVLDVMMPGRSGFILIKQLKKDEQLRDIPVLMISGVAGILDELESHKDETFESPYDNLRESLKKKIQEMRENGLLSPEMFMDKPVSPDSFIRKVQELIGS